MRQCSQLKTNNYGKVCSVPLNSSLKFGILHDSQSGNKAASLGALTYKTIGNLALCCIPVRALQNFRSSETTSSVEAEEVLIIKEVICIPYNHRWLQARAYQGSARVDLAACDKNVT